MTFKRTGRMIVVAAAVAILPWSSWAQAQNWPRFRGENGSGVSDVRGIPTTWSPGDYAWNVSLPGVGHSSPVIWNDRLFLTSAVDEGKLRYLLCLDASSGEKLWIKEMGLSQSSKHNKSSWASASPATDGERVYVAFSDKRDFYLTAYDFSGELVWQRNLGGFEGRHGQGSSPLIFEDLLIVANDHTGPSSVIAFDRRTGRTVWSTLKLQRRTSYATPLVASIPGRSPQLICSSGGMGVASLDPYTGRLNWMTGELPARTVASPIFSGELIIQPCGGGGVGKHLVAVDPFTDPASADKRIRYTREKNLPYVPTPISYGDHLYLWNDNGVVNCVETATGDNVWTKRVGGKYTGSPICVDGKIYIMSETGQVAVVSASPEYKFYGKSQLDDPSHSTPAVAGGRLYLRTFHRLACLEGRP